MMRNRNEGFTLIELLIAMGIAIVVMGGVYYTFQVQQASYVTQENLSSMQQNMRAAMYFMEKDIRMAGCNPTEEADDAGMITSGVTRAIHFTMDIVNDSNPPVMVSDGDVEDEGESIEYTIAFSAASGTTVIRREDINKHNGPQPIAEDIDALQFYHLDINGSLTNTLSRVRSVQIAIVARTGRPIRGHTDNKTYRVTLPDGTVQDVFGPANDHYRRKLLTTVIRCRNLGV